MTQTGLQMLLKAMGVNPQELIAKGMEMASMMETLGAIVQSKVVLIDSRLARIEVQLALLSQMLHAARGEVEPAGLTSLDLIEISEEPKESKPNGRYS